MPVSIKLTRESVQPEGEPLVQHVWPIKITAEGTGIDSEIFVYHAAAGDDPIEGDIFIAVASVPQMDELPKDNPALLDGEIIPFYRKSVLEFAARNPEQAEYIWEEVQKDVDDLVVNTNTFERLGPVEEVIIEE